MINGEADHFITMKFMRGGVLMTGRASSHRHSIRGLYAWDETASRRLDPASPRRSLPDEG